MARVYVLADDSNKIIRIEGESTLPEDLTGWTKIDEGEGERFDRAQAKYLDKFLYTDDGIPRYKLEAGEVVERSDEEIQADLDAIPEPDPSPTEEIIGLIDDAMLAITELYEMIIG